MANTASPSLSQALGRAAKIMRLLEQAGMTDDDFQLIINDNALRYQFIEAWRAIQVSPIKTVEVPEYPNEERLELLLRHLCELDYQRNGLKAVVQTAFTRLVGYYTSPGAFRQLVAGCVNDRDASILVVRYGLVTGVPMTQAEVGKVFNIGPGRISSLERRAVRQLSFGMRKHLEEFLELHVDELLKNGHHSVEELDQGDQHNLSMWLKNHDVYTIEQLTELTEAEVLHVFSFHAMGLGHQGSVDNVKEQLASRGLKLKDV